MKRFLLLLAVILLIGSGYFTYDKWIKHSSLTTWSFVPSDAAIVIELEIIKDIENAKGNPFWKTLENTDFIKHIDQRLQFLDSINGDGGFSAIFKSTPGLAAIHKVGSSKLDVLYVLDIQNLSQNTFVSAAMGRLKQQGYRLKTRSYNGFTISELENEVEPFSFIFYKHFFLASSTPYLIEDAIRTIEGIGMTAFKESHRINEGNIHVNFEQFPDLLGALVTPSTDLPLVSGSYQLAADSSTLTVSGFSQVGQQWQEAHTSSPGQFEMVQVIPTNTSAVFHYTSTDFPSFGVSQVNSIKEGAEMSNYLDSLKKNYDFEVTQVYDLISEELGIVYLESNRPDRLNKFLVLKSEKVSEAMQYLEKLVGRITYSRGDSVYSEAYSKNEIRFLPIKEFPQCIVGDLAKGFDQCFYTSVRNYIIFSNSLQELKDLIASIEAEDTWGKSIQMTGFLSNASQNANMSLIVNVPRVWSLLTPLFKSEWETSFKQNERAYQQIELAAFQFSYLDDQYFSNFTFSQPAKVTPNVTKTRSDNSVTFGFDLTTKPFLVRTHKHNFFDFLVQDSAFNVYYLDRSFSSLWTENVRGEIKGEVYAIDYYGNNKFQYAFATDKEIHIIDRTGQYIPGYPKALPTNANIDHLNLIDYDKNKNYRLGITDVDGKVFLTDKNLKVLEGWDPIPYKRPAIKPLSHARLGNRDVMISIQKNGLINVTNRRGIKHGGFPFDVRANVSEDYFLNASNSLGSSTLTVITLPGELVEINLEGIVINREQLIKTSPETTFKMVLDRGKKSFVIIRKEGNAYAVLDATGNLLFEKEYFSSSELIIQYYQFGGGKGLVTFVDPAAESLYIYDLAGELITGNALASNNPVSLLYSSSRRRLQVYTTSGANLEYYEFNY